jgi:hypothetical protein
VPSASPSLRLAVGLVVSLVTIAGVGLYTAHEIRQLRDEQTAISDRNRKDSLQLLRIQNALGTLATSMRDMADHTEPYPLVAWRQTFERLHADLAQALAVEGTLAPPERPTALQLRLVASVDHFWTLMDDVFGTAESGSEEAAVARLRGPVAAAHMELVGMVSQFLVLNNRVQEEASARNRAIYERVVWEIGILVVAAAGGGGHGPLHHPRQPPGVRAGGAAVG